MEHHDMYQKNDWPLPMCDNLTRPCRILVVTSNRHCDFSHDTSACGEGSAALRLKEKPPVEDNVIQSAHKQQEQRKTREQQMRDS